MRKLHEKLAEKKLNLDKRTLEKIDAIEKAGVIIGKTLELLQSLKAQHESRGFLTEAQRALVRKIEKDYEDYPLWLESRERLAQLYNEDALDLSSYSFVQDVVAWFDEHHKWTPLQLEQIITIIQKHAPAKDEAEEGKS